MKLFQVFQYKHPLPTRTHNHTITQSHRHTNAASIGWLEQVHELLAGTVVLMQLVLLLAVRDDGAVVAQRCWMQVQVR